MTNLILFCCLRAAKLCRGLFAMQDRFLFLHDISLLRKGRLAFLQKQAGGQAALEGLEQSPCPAGAVFFHRQTVLPQREAALGRDRKMTDYFFEPSFLQPRNFAGHRENRTNQQTKRPQGSMPLGALFSRETRRVFLGFDGKRGYAWGRRGRRRNVCRAAKEVAEWRAGRDC